MNVFSSVAVNNNKQSQNDLSNRSYLACMMTMSKKNKDSVRWSRVQPMRTSGTSCRCGWSTCATGNDWIGNYGSFAGSPVLCFSFSVRRRRFRCELLDIRLDGQLHILHDVTTRLFETLHIWRQPDETRPHQRLDACCQLRNVYIERRGVETTHRLRHLFHLAIDRRRRHREHKIRDEVVWIEWSEDSVRRNKHG